MVSNSPFHLAIIPDGNRRWAKARTLLPWQGHEKALKNFQSVLTYCIEHTDISVLTLWCFSTENWNRDQEEIDKLMNLLHEYLEAEKPRMLKENIRFCHSGRRDRIPPHTVTLIEELEAATADFDGFTLQLLIDHGGKDDIVRALHKANKQSSDISESDLEACLDHSELPPIDIVIRTSGEQRTSGFAMWQAAYSEWFFLQKHFPELAKEDIDQVLDDFSKRNRRFGGG